MDTDAMNDDRGVTRRRALGLLAGATATGLVAACSASSGKGEPAPRTAPLRRSASTAPTPRSSDPTPVVPPTELRALNRSLDGTIHAPGTAGYDAARLLFDRRFDGVTPAVVARVANATDIATCLDFARQHALGIVLRSGGHSYIGASIGEGLVIDLRSLDDVTVNHAAGTATIGAGAALVDVYNTLADHGVAIPAGSCPTVGISGLTLGGGVGVVTRRYGLTCDRLVEATVVTATGEVVTCNAQNHSDLYWALRGGGGSFGVVTSMTLSTHPTESLAHAYVTWPWSAAAAVVGAWQRWATAAPRSLWSSTHVLSTGMAGPPTVSVGAVMVDSTAALEEQIGRLTQLIATPPTTNFVTSEGYAATMMLEAGCAQLSVEECHVGVETPGGTLPRDAFVAGSDYFRELIPATGIAALVSAVEHRQSDPRLGTGGAAFDVLGGAVDDVAADATAWVHRGALFGAQYTASWGSTPGNAPLARNQHSLAKIHHSVRGYASGEAYQNYADDTLANPQQAYYGANLARLIEVRRTYDPTGVFTQPQGVPLS